MPIPKDIKESSSTQTVLSLPANYKTEIVEAEPSFVGDVLPFFGPSVFLVFNMTVFYYTGNQFLGLWILYGCLLLNAAGIKSRLYKFIGIDISINDHNIGPKSSNQFENDKRFLIPLFVYCILENVFWIWVLMLFSDRVPEDDNLFYFKPKTRFEIFALTFISIWHGGINQTCGHELLHKKPLWCKILGGSVFTKMGYSHYFDSHTKDHHRKVGTPEDSSTAKKNESVWTFLPRSVITSHYRIWQMEVSNIKKKDGENVSSLMLILKNKMLYYFFIHLSMFTIIYHFLGWTSVKFQLFYCLFTILELKAGDYAQHYGVLRSKDENGIYNSIDIYQSWNSSMGTMFAQIQRHSDHHLHTFRPYQILRKVDDAPTLPFIYFHSFLIVYCPPIWFYIMNPMVDALHSKLKKMTPE